MGLVIGLFYAISSLLIIFYLSDINYQISYNSDGNGFIGNVFLLIFLAPMAFLIGLSNSYLISFIILILIGGVIGAIASYLMKNERT